MSAATYSLEAWRRFRERKERPPESHVSAGTSLADIPADAEMDDGIVIGFWNGERFVSWEKWLATAPLAVDPSPPPALAHDATDHRRNAKDTRRRKRDAARPLLAGLEDCR